MSFTKSKEDNCEENMEDTPINSDEVDELTESEHSDEESEQMDDSDEYIDEKNLNEDQKKVFEYVKQLLLNNDFRKANPTTVCIHGAAGTGKTELLKMIGTFVSKNYFFRGPVYVASSGIAAMNFHEGRTAHSKFKFPFQIPNESSTSICQMNDYQLEDVMPAPIILYDEVNMTERQLIEMLDRTLSAHMQSTKLFGGKIVVFAGDFLQIPPITNQHSLKDSPLWSKIKHFELKTPLRSQNDINFTNFLKKLRNGDIKALKPADCFNFNKYVPLHGIKFTSTFDKFIEFVYPENVLDCPDVAAKRAILASTGEAATLTNKHIIRRIKGKTQVCESTEESLGIEFKYDEPNSIPDRNLALKKGSICMIVRNIYEPDTFLTGTRVIIEEIDDNHNTVMVRKPGTNKLHAIRRERFVSNKFGSSESFFQFPLRMCYAMTIHKSQGQEFDKVGIDLRQPLFNHGRGLLYLAMSRVKGHKDVLVLVNGEQIINDVAHAII